ncbi:hypothetical protein EVG20_g4094 [Dentipellis fragilis]|uniref:Uncharacterized protein n=1 Tax=Dentipellis fragilis TaxID=205917 RepID=A0A4Y9YZA9_9AGAM|nr:hypothetical protein EVG20_g4094 [Dentipellis fragilis]
MPTFVRGTSTALRAQESLQRRRRHEQPYPAIINDDHRLLCTHSIYSNPRSFTVHCGRNLSDRPQFQSHSPALPQSGVDVELAFAIKHRCLCVLSVPPTLPLNAIRFDQSSFTPLPTSSSLILPSAMTSSQSEDRISQTQDRSVPELLIDHPPTTMPQGELVLARAEEHIRMLKAELSMWRTCRNSTLPVASLSSEILTSIFSSLAGMDFLFNMKNPEGPYCRKSLGWITATHVCRHWRNVALGTPWLWRNLVNFQAGGMETMLERSVRIPLCVEFDIVPSKFRSRLKILEKPASRLQALTLVINEPKKKTPIARVPLIPHTLLRSAQGSLQNLTLDTVYLDWGRFRFPALVSLELIYPEIIGRRAERKHLPIISTFVSALAAMPKLRILRLCNAISIKSLWKDSPDSATRTPLPHLAELETDMDMRLCTLLLRHLAIPNEAVIGVTNYLDGQDPKSQNLIAQLDELQDHLTAFQLRATPAFQMSITSRGHEARVRAECPTSESVGFCGAFNFGESPTRALITLFRKLPLDRVNAFELGSFEPDPHTFDTQPKTRPSLEHILDAVAFELPQAHTVAVACADDSPDNLLALLTRDPATMPRLEKLVIRFNRRLHRTSPPKKLRLLLDSFARRSPLLKTIVVRASTSRSLEEFVGVGGGGIEVHFIKCRWNDKVAPDAGVIVGVGFGEVDDGVWDLPLLDE